MGEGSGPCATTTLTRPGSDCRAESARHDPAYWRSAARCGSTRSDSSTAPAGSSSTPPASPPSGWPASPSVASPSPCCGSCPSGSGAGSSSARRRWPPTAPPGCIAPRRRPGSTVTPASRCASSRPGCGATSRPSAEPSRRGTWPRSRPPAVPPPPGGGRRGGWGHPQDLPGPGSGQQVVVEDGYPHRTPSFVRRNGGDRVLVWGWDVTVAAGPPGCGWWSASGPRSRSCGDRCRSSGGRPSDPRPPTST